MNIAMSTFPIGLLIMILSCRHLREFSVYINFAIYEVFSSVAFREHFSCKMI